MSKHTAGPWRVGDAGHTVFGPPNGEPSPETIASVKKRANARLIAAAPDLLNALTHAVVLLHDLNPGTQAAEEVAIIITDALKKATS